MIRAAMVSLVVLGSTSVSAGESAVNNFRPLSSAEFRKFEATYYLLSDCQKEYSARTGLTPQLAAERIVAGGSADRFIQDTLRVLPATDSAVSFLTMKDLPMADKIPIAMVGLAGYAVKPELLPVQSMRAFALVRKYFAKATGNSCQPSNEFNKTLKVMLDANF